MTRAIGLGTQRDDRSDRDALIEAYFRNARAPRNDDTDRWAWQEVFEIVHYDPPDAADTQRALKPATAQGRRHSAW